MKKLTPKENVFVDEYLIDLDPQRAGLAAGFSKTMAASKCYQWVTNGKVKPHVYAAIQKQLKLRSERTQVTSDMVVKELARIGFSDLRKMLTDKGSLLDPQDWDDDTAAAISSIEVVTNTGEKGKDDDGRRIIEHTHKIKVWDKNSALEKLGKHLSMFTDKIDHSNTDGSFSMFMENVAAKGKRLGRK